MLEIDTEKEIYGYIYKCTYAKNGKIYVGASKYMPGLETYLGSGKKWTTEVLSNCNKNDIVKEILEFVYSKRELLDREIYWISHFNSTDTEIGYNISPGGSTMTEDSKQQMRLANSKTMKHIMATTDCPQRISKGLSEYRRLNGVSKEHRQHLSDSLKGRNVGCDGDSRSIQVYCIINNTKHSFHNKITAAKWWFDTYPFSDIYSAITYTRLITKSINNEPLTYNSKLITNPIKWFIDDIKITENSPVYCIYNNDRYDFATTESAAEWWFETYPLSDD